MDKRRKQPELDGLLDTAMRLIAREFELFESAPNDLPRDQAVRLCQYVDVLVALKKCEIDVRRLDKKKQAYLRGLSDQELSDLEERIRNGDVVDVS